MTGDSDSVQREWFSTRMRLGLIAIGLLIGAIFWRAETASAQGFRTAMVRVGVLAAAVWLAWPTLENTRWAPKTRAGRYAVGTIGALVIARPWVFLPIAIPLGVLYLLKRPSRKPPV